MNKTFLADHKKTDLTKEVYGNGFRMVLSDQKKTDLTDLTTVDLMKAFCGNDDAFEIFQLGLTMAMFCKVDLRKVSCGNDYSLETS